MRNVTGFAVRNLIVSAIIIVLAATAVASAQDSGGFGPSRECRGVWVVSTVPLPPGSVFMKKEILLSLATLDDLRRWLASPDVAAKQGDAFVVVKYREFGSRCFHAILVLEESGKH